MNLKLPPYLPLAVSALLTLFFALWGGLVSLQWRFPLPQANWLSFHGPLMVSGFFGTIIGLGRSGALKSKAGLAVPLAAALGAWILLLGGPERWGAFCFLAASLGYLLLCRDFSTPHLDSYTLLALVGGGGWVWGNVMWLAGRPVLQLVVAWQVFFVLTITSERLKVIRWRASGYRSLPPFLGAGLMGAGALGQPFNPVVGIRLASAGYAVMAVFLLGLDAARRTERMWSWGVYTKACRYSRYGWLLACAAIGLWLPPVEQGFAYDAFLHCLFLGFVFFMVFNHAPLLLPRVLKTPVPFHPVFYLHWFLLHISLAARVGGDLLGLADWRRWGGLLNALALIIFILNTLWGIRNGRRLAASFKRDSMESEPVSAVHPGLADS